MSRRIEKLHTSHAIDAFDCGNEHLNRFLKRHALLNQLNGTSTTFVGLVDQMVVGYYALAAGAVTHEEAPERVRAGLPKYPIPVTLLARLAVDRQWHNQGIGKALLRDAMLRTLNVATEMGICAILVHAKNDAAKAFYEHFNFLPSPTDPLHLFIALKDI